MQFSTVEIILREKSLAIIYNGFSQRRSFKYYIFLLASALACQLFENDLMATRKRSKETNSNFIARILSDEHFNFKRYSIEREII